jgi:hypothetical protein
VLARIRQLVLYRLGDELAERIPRSAAADLARRKMASGISSVVFMVLCSHIYKSDQVLRVGQGFERPVSCQAPLITHGEIRVRNDA